MTIDSFIIKQPLPLFAGPWCWSWIKTGYKLRRMSCSVARQSSRAREATYLLLQGGNSSNHEKHMTHVVTGRDFHPIDIIVVRSHVSWHDRTEASAWKQWPDGYFKRIRYCSIHSGSPCCVVTVVIWYSHPLCLAWLSCITRRVCVQLGSGSVTITTEHTVDSKLTAL